MPLKMVFVMDPLESINPERDTTLVLMLEAQARGHKVLYAPSGALSARGGKPFCEAAETRLTKPGEDAKNMDGFYETDEFKPFSLAGADVVWMRKDPPFDMDYIYLTHILELAENGGAAVINRPRAIRNSNEKLSALGFSRFMPDTVVSKSRKQIGGFLNEKGKIVLKPLDGFGGEGIVMAEKTNADAREKIDRATQNGKAFIMAQEFISGVSGGDKRVIMLGGKPLGAVLRMPPEDGFICNFHSGGTPAKTTLNKRDMEICGALEGYLNETGIYFAGIDIVDGMLTEINCTSPTCVREINRLEDVRLESDIMDFAESLTQEAGRKKRL